MNVSMETTGNSLILTKLRPPASRSRTVQRARLLQRLTLEPGTDLVLISAPAGYGKTTLLVEWSHLLRHAGMTVAWYSLDENDNNPIAFGSYLVASLELALGPGSGLEPVGQVLRASSELDLLRILPTIVNAVCANGSNVILVLDDYHLIRTSSIHQTMEFLINHRPENLSLAIGSRTNPPLPLARLRARGRLIELRAADLRFTEDETGQFLRNSMQVDIPVDLSSQLAEQVEGWAAGLQLAALSLSGRPASENLLSAFTGQHKHLAEYLLEEVINQLPEALQSFLLYTSILERMSAPVCDAILSIKDSAKLLSQLEQSNLFVVALDEEGIWFRYHHLFRDFLRTWLKRTQPEQASALHQAASRWFAGHGLLREAAYHAFRCEDWSFAANFVEQHSFTLIIQSEIATIYEWCSAFPESVMRNRPKLCIFQGLALAYRFQGKYRARVEARLQQAEQAIAALGNSDLAFEAGELSAVVQTFLAMIPDPGTDAHKQLELALSRLAAYPSGDPGRFSWLLIAGYAYLALSLPEKAAAVFEESLPLALNSGLYFGMVEATFHLARLAYSQGQLTTSLEICRKGQEELSVILQPPGLALPALGCLNIAAGCVFLEQGKLIEAEQQLFQGLERMGWGMNPYYLMTAYLAQFRLLEIRGQMADAMACLDQLDTLWPDIQFLTEGLRVQSLLRRYPDDAVVVQSARDWLHSFGLSLGGDLPLYGLGPIGAAEAFYQANLIWLRLQIAIGQPQVVPPYLQGQLQLAHEKGLAGREIELALIKSQFLRKQGNEEQALVALERALTIGGPAGYLSVFDQSGVLDELIHLAARQGIAHGYIERILNTIRNKRSREAGPASMSTITDQVVESLSERELEVLGMIATGATNQEIANRLVITIGTVKSHINHILGKLGVGNRTEAAAKARQLGYLGQK